MSTAIQFDLFEENDEHSLQKKEIQLLQEQLNNVRRGLFQRFSNLEKLYLKQQERIEELESKLKTKAETFEFPLRKTSL